MVVRLNSGRAARNRNPVSEIRRPRVRIVIEVRDPHAVWAHNVLARIFFTMVPRGPVVFAPLLLRFFVFAARLQVFFLFFARIAG